MKRPPVRFTQLQEYERAINLLTHAVRINPELSAAVRNVDNHVRELTRLVRTMLENDPNDMAADAVTVLAVWRRAAARALDTHETWEQ